MRRRRRAPVLVGLVLALSMLQAACADADPRYGAPDSIRGRVIDWDESPTTPALEGGAALPPRELFVTAVYPSIRPTCASCHAPGGAGPPFLGADADTSLAALKTKGYDRANSKLVTRGAHLGPALTSAQLAVIATWHAAEARDGGATDGGGGGG